MAKEYLLSIDMFSNPKVVEGSQAKALKILRLILMNPGSDPLHPEMGVGIKNYRFGSVVGDNFLNSLVDKTNEQVEQYLPQLQNAIVDYTVTTDRKLSIDIQIQDELYTYQMETEPTLEDIAET